MPGPGAVRRIYARTTYPEAICGIGVRLADALQYAHERGLVHLDIRGSNIVVASDGQPMLLDFHLAREPLRARPRRYEDALSNLETAAFTLGVDRSTIS
jgi:serine/threonine protein kinase